MAEIARCPYCNTSIDEGHRRRECPGCNRQLPDEIKGRLREFQPLVIAGAPGQNAASVPQTSPDPAIAKAAPQNRERSLAYRYTVYPFVGRIKTGFFSTDNAATVSEQLKRVINDHATEGWEFVSVEKIDIDVQPGCLGSLFGQKASSIAFDQIVFRAPCE